MKKTKLLDRPKEHKEKRFDSAMYPLLRVT